MALGYTHSDHSGTPGSYKRDGSIIHMCDPWTEHIWSIEWYDTEVDSIIETSKNGEKRNFRDTIDIKSLRVDTDIKRKDGVLNTALWTILDGTIILIGCDFLSYIETLRSREDGIHFTDFHREDARDLDVSIPGITHIDALREYIQARKENAKICIYTKYEKSVREFLDYNSLTNVDIVAMTKGGLESFEIVIDN